MPIAVDTSSAVTRSHAPEGSAAPVAGSAGAGTGGAGGGGAGGGGGGGGGRAGATATGAARRRPRGCTARRESVARRVSGGGSAVQARGVEEDVQRVDVGVVSGVLGRRLHRVGQRDQLGELRDRGGVAGGAGVAARAR